MTSASTRLRRTLYFIWPYRPMFILCKHIWPSSAKGEVIAIRRQVNQPFNAFNQRKQIQFSKVQFCTGKRQEQEGYHPFTKKNVSCWDERKACFRSCVLTIHKKTRSERRFSVLNMFRMHLMRFCIVGLAFGYFNQASCDWGWSVADTRISSQYRCISFGLTVYYDK